jgi:8-oxo-dGTP diphosphatase
MRPEPVTSGPVTPGPIRVVAAVFVDRDRYLACRRAPGRDAAGRWEFPGGKVEPGEEAEAALCREIAEELGVVIDVGELVDRSTTTTGGRAIDLSCYRVARTDRLPTDSTDHDRFHWCRRIDLTTLAWAEPDLPAVRRLSSATSP